MWRSFVYKAKEMLLLYLSELVVGVIVVACFLALVESAK